MGSMAIPSRLLPLWLAALALSTISGHSFAEKGKAANNALVLDVGAYMTQVDRRFSAPAGYAGQVSTLAGFLRARKALSLSSSFGWEPSIGLLLPWRSGGDGFAKTFMVHGGVGFGVNPLQWLRVRFGPGLLWRLTITNSEEVSLNNGTGTSGFYLPGGSRSVFQFTADAGLDFRFFQSVSLGFDVWVLEIMNSNRRTMNAAITLGFYL